MVLLWQPDKNTFMKPVCLSVLYMYGAAFILPVATAAADHSQYSIASAQSEPQPQKQATRVDPSYETLRGKCQEASEHLSRKHSDRTPVNTGKVSTKSAPLQNDLSKLKLSPDQEKKLAKFLEKRDARQKKEREKQLKAMAKQQQKREKERAAYEAELLKILTPEQYEELQSMQVLQRGMKRGGDPAIPKQSGKTDRKRAKAVLTSADNHKPVPDTGQQD